MRLIVRNWLVAPLLLVPMTPLHSQLRLHGRYILTSSEVAHAISTAFSRDYPDAAQPNILLLADVTATEADPRLDVQITSVEPPVGITRTKQEIVVQMRCHTPGVCLPFYALVFWPSPPTSTVIGDRQMPGPPTSKIAVHTGAKVMLVLEGVGTRFELPVVALQSGEAGTRIRAVSLDRRHTFTAKVISANVLKGDL